jgi:hypothetical protein
MREIEVLKEYNGKVVLRAVEHQEAYGNKYRIEFTDGSWIDFHGGSVGYDNADPYFDTSVPVGR